MAIKITLPTYETLLADAIRSLAVDSGTVTSPSPVFTNILNDSTKNWAVDALKDCMVKIIRGAGAGQLTVIASNTPKSLLIAGAWAMALDTTSVYVILAVDPRIEGKLDNPTFGLAAIKAAINSLAGGAFYGSYGPKNVEVGNDVDFGTILYDPSGNIITVGEITPGTYTVRRVRGAADTEIVHATASSEAGGRVYMTYNFPVADWAVGDIFYITFAGIIVTIGGVITEYPDLYIWGRVVREADISGKVDTILQEEADVAVSVNANAPPAPETDVLNLAVANTRYVVRSLRLKCANPGGNTVTVRLYELVSNALTAVDSFDITNENFATYHSCMDMFGMPYLAGDRLQVTVQVSAGAAVAITGQYTLAKATI